MMVSLATWFIHWNAQHVHISAGQQNASGSKGTKFKKPTEVVNVDVATIIWNTKRIFIVRFS